MKQKMLILITNLKNVYIQKMNTDKKNQIL